MDKAQEAGVLTVEPPSNNDEQKNPCSSPTSSSSKEYDMQITSSSKVPPSESRFSTQFDFSLPPFRKQIQNEFAKMLQFFQYGYRDITLKISGREIHKKPNSIQDKKRIVSPENSRNRERENKDWSDSGKPGVPQDVHIFSKLKELTFVQEMKGFPFLNELESLKGKSLGQEIEKLKKLKDSIPEIEFEIPTWGKPIEGFASVQEYYRYKEVQGKRLFDELDSDKDGRVSLEDLEKVMRRRRLPVWYARAFLQRTRRHFLASSFGWEEFKQMADQREETIFKAFSSLKPNASGTLQKRHVLSSLKEADLPATAANARAMMSYLAADSNTGKISYGQFRDFSLLLPQERLDPSKVWFEAATMVQNPIYIPPSAPAGSVLKSAVIGGLISGLPTLALHSVDTLKTRVQASSKLKFTDVLESYNKPGGLRTLYRGSIPAVLGQFGSHFLRTGVFEALKLLLPRLRPDSSEPEVQAIASFVGSVLGTCIRIPCEVLKQRLQAEMYSDVIVALKGTLKEEGMAGLFRGTSATLLREVPFYVAGSLIYQEAKKVVTNVAGRELGSLELLLLGGCSGGMAAVCTTPFDVLKTRMMIAVPLSGKTLGMRAMCVAIVEKEGFWALYKGALPRFFWIAPLGALHFAGYELAKRAQKKTSP